MDSRLVNALRHSVRDCSDRGLSAASRWSSELLLSIPPSRREALLSDPASTFSTSTPARSRSPRPSISFADPSPAPGGGLSVPSTPAGQPRVPPIDSNPPDLRIQEIEWESRDEASLSVAQAYVASKEFSRAVHTLRDCKSAKARFLSIYSQYLATEKKALRDWYKLCDDRKQPPIPINRSLLELLGMVKNATDPWLLFLKALFLSRLSRREEAIESIILSISGYPWNWSAWTLFGNCVGDGEEMSSLLPLIPLSGDHPLVQMFQIKTMNELHSPTENELAMCDHLLTDDFFKGSPWVMSLRACVLYHLHDFGQAEKQFEKILALDPYRIDNIDVYSNILYVTENRLKLSRLAHEFLELDKDRPEVCCLVGNHYSLRAEHEKAVKYFRRATELDRTYLSAWTLMGHEYVEMKNSHAAIEAYRRAVDVNRKDYRAWYGLGQAYELLSMHQYALHYYQHATALRPYDVRLWQAQGSCYEELGRLREAVECHKRALLGADPRESTINLKLAKLHEDLNEPADAAAYHRRVVEVCRIEERPVQDYAKSSIYVARHHMTTTGGDLLLAKEYLERVAQSNAEEVALASDYLKKLKAILLVPKPSAPTEAHLGSCEAFFLV
ncbi:TPR-like protein [Leucogyrophana mollusca]|uniref:TPR-like protein n=1 Tax=Leucogyrophana mollusca TaxID=85980 RepID=A0ACB8BNI3_9AGAM|nr:TPR-like protein [Leucogyrophana mollusca]